MTPPPGWKQVSFAADCTWSDGWSVTPHEPGDLCSICGLDYCEDCECPGPTQDDLYEYQEFEGVLYAKPIE